MKFEDSGVPRKKTVRRSAGGYIPLAIGGKGDAKSLNFRLLLEGPSVGCVRADATVVVVTGLQHNAIQPRCLRFTRNADSDSDGDQTREGEKKIMSKLMASKSRGIVNSQTQPSI
jgi:hypothetical protein